MESQGVQGQSTAQIFERVVSAEDLSTDQKVDRFLTDLRTLHSLGATKIPEVVDYFQTLGSVFSPEQTDRLKVRFLDQLTVKEEAISNSAIAYIGDLKGEIEIARLLGLDKIKEVGDYLDLVEQIHGISTYLTPLISGDYTWRAQDGDIPVRVTGSLGMGADGGEYMAVTEDGKRVQAVDMLSAPKLDKEWRYKRPRIVPEFAVQKKAINAAYYQLGQPVNFGLRDVATLGFNEILKSVPVDQQEQMKSLRETIINQTVEQMRDDLAEAIYREKISSNQVSWYKLTDNRGDREEILACLDKKINFKWVKDWSSRIKRKEGYVRLPEFEPLRELSPAEEFKHEAAYLNEISQQSLEAKEEALENIVFLIARMDLVEAAHLLQNQPIEVSSLIYPALKEALPDECQLIKDINTAEMKALMAFHEATSQRKIEQGSPIEINQLYEKAMDAVYPAEDLRPIDEHLIYGDLLAEGIAGLLSLKRVGELEKPAVTAYLQAVSPQLGIELMTDVIKNEATLSIVPDHEPTLASLQDELKAAAILGLEEGQYQQKLAELRAKYLPRIEPLA